MVNRSVTHVSFLLFLYIYIYKQILCFEGHEFFEEFLERGRHINFS